MRISGTKCYEHLASRAPTQASTPSTETKPVDSTATTVTEQQATATEQAAAKKTEAFQNVILGRRGGCLGSAR